ncbi:MAG: oligosaccharide flippase family protein [Bacteroidota bacterium]|nr:oligosaccharide flippase family protein [Bacteroidota bacterium]MDP4215150.1 oligosaccharide flippase family protein [Bacteroidota bacterium]MDP4260377.1 oligosaccharide flippase family protein [Bacteroidota bacterium]
MKKYLSSYWIRSAFYTFLQRFSLTIFGLANFMILIRSLSDKNKTQMSVWALFVTVTTIFEATKSSLLKNAHIKYVSGDVHSPGKTAIASSSLLINALINLIFIVFILLFANWFSDLFHMGDYLAGMLRWYIPGMIGMVFFSHFEAIQQSHFDFKGVFAGNLVRQAAFFSVIFAHFLMKEPFSLTHLAIYQSASILLGTITIYFFSRKYLLYRFDPSIAWIRKILGYGGYIFGSGIISNVFSNLDQLMTGAFLSLFSGAVATYNAATRINNFIDIPSYAATEILFPKLSQAVEKEGTQKVRYLYERMVSVLLAVIIPAAIFVILVPGFVIHVIAGPGYEAAVPILQLYMLNSVIGTMQNQAANTLNSIGRPGLCLALNAISLSAKLLITYLCLKGFGFYGAAIGTVITSVISGTLWYIMMSRQIGSSLVNVLRYIPDNYRIVYANAVRIVSRDRARA